MMFFLIILFMETREIITRWVLEVNVNSILVFRGMTNNFEMVERERKGIAFMVLLRI